MHSVTECLDAYEGIVKMGRNLKCKGLLLERVQDARRYACLQHKDNTLRMCARAVVMFVCEVSEMYARGLQSWVCGGGAVN